MRFEEILVTLTGVTGLVTLVNYCYQKQRSKTISATAKQNWVIETCRSFFPVFLIVLILRSFLFEAFRIPTGSMKPTLVEGDFIVVNKYSYGVRLPVLGTKLISVGTPKTGDIIVFRHTDGKDLIKRVIGVPGDHVRYANKHLYINGVLVPTKFYADSNDGFRHVQQSVEFLANIPHYIFIDPEQRREDHFKYNDVIVPDNCYFAMGDNRDNSEDGRFWGFVHDEDLLGKAVITWLSWNSDGSGIDLVRWSRFGKSLYVPIAEPVESGT